ncbi:hypothetical protein Clacol_009540 [Clathrus columnatus]|uniref:Uncharacterized protein n=1 Tax=Clathrus columnatus TaxID=1419009 RepID=A0AAV5ARA6_9AGAM|nr:hypothetical protein Clacol_009540 [Clathrus columnatus]
MERVGVSVPKAVVIGDDEGRPSSSYLTRRQLSIHLRIRGNWWKERKNFEDLSKALLKSRCVLSQLIVLLTGAKTDRIGLAMVLQPNLLMPLSKFSLSDLVFSFDRAEEEVYVDIIASLSQAQNLTHLCLKLNAVLPTVGYIFVSHGYWPKLQHLSLPGFAISSPSNHIDWQNQIQSFLERHINIQTLILPTYMLHSGTITGSGRALSNLRALELDNIQNHNIYLLDQIPSRISEMLSHLTITTGSRLLPGLGLSITTLEILRRLPWLRSCILYYNEEDGKNFVIRAVEFLVNGSPLLQKLWMRVHDVNPPV